MLTIFTCPKAFKGHIDIIQRNAIGSWMQLEPKCEILLMGDDEGVAEAAADFGARHISRVEKNEHGAPLVSSLFERAQEAAGHEILAYVNADIILGQEFIEAAELCMPLRRFLMIGERMDLALQDSLKFSDMEWWPRLKQMTNTRDSRHGVTGLDYFLFTRGVWDVIPPFALGRGVWDNWFLYAVRRQKIPLVDASGLVTAIHQNHDYAHQKIGSWATGIGPETTTNLALAGGYEHAFTADDATHLMNHDGPYSARDRRHVLQRVRRLHVLHPQLHRYLVSWKMRYLLCFLFPLF